MAFARIYQVSVPEIHVRGTVGDHPKEDRLMVTLLMLLVSLIIVAITVTSLQTGLPKYRWGLSSVTPGIIGGEQVTLVNWGGVSSQLSTMVVLTVRVSDLVGSPCDVAVMVVIQYHRSIGTKFQTVDTVKNMVVF